MIIMQVNEHSDAFVSARKTGRWLIRSTMPILPQSFIVLLLLEEIPKHMDEEDRSFLEDLLPWAQKLPEEIRK